MKFKFVITALAVALATSFAVAAAEDVNKAVDTGKQLVVPADKTDKAAQPGKGALKGHDHSAFHKQGAPRTATLESASLAKKPLHDHGKFHKQQ